VLPYVDEALLSRLGALEEPAALAAIQALEEADFGHNCE
jgi:hypothetical protein